jgi:hypothetical protein
MHPIRLRGPWQWRVVERFDGADDLVGGRTQMPGDWAELVGRDFLGRVRFTRGFNRPTNLDPHQRVWLVFDLVDHEASAALNGALLETFTASDCPRRFDVTELLLPRNELVVEVTLRREIFSDPRARGHRAHLPGGLPGEVRLEIQ